mgnify:FL=1
MKKWNRILGLILITGIAFWVGTSIDTKADSAKPGSIDDPLVTKSYVDSLLAGGGVQTGGGRGAASGIEAKVVVVNPGSVLMAKSGAMIIPRAGKGVAYSSDANGISDVTDGKDILSGQPVTNNHLLIFPRDGRGVMPDPNANGPLTVLVMGEYEIAAAPKSSGS